MTSSTARNSRPRARAADPDLLLRGYERAALTLNFVRALVDGGFADLHHPEYWDLGFVKHAPLKDAYQRIIQSIGDALDFFEGMSGTAVHEATLVDFYASHEGLHLLYEQAQTRFIPRQNRWYNLSTHMPWIGMRTAKLDGAHVEYFRGIANPIGVKVGTAMDAAWLQGLVTTLNPQNQPGRLTLIHRFGAKDIATALPQGHRGRAGDRPDRALGLRSDARQHGDQHRRTEDPALREHSEGARYRLPHSCARWALTWAACTSS